MTEEKHNDRTVSSRQDRFGVLTMLRKNIILRGVAIVLIVALTLVLLFSLTMAWYTNVIRTGGLSFTPETWNFSGQVLFDETEKPISIAPGDTGTVYMRMTNESDELAAAGVTVSKADMNTAEGKLMQQRLYFYVDTVAVRNGETMDRVYISDSRSYTYTLFPQSELFFSEIGQNAPPLKWEWVYDVLGYYVLGTIHDDGTVNTGEPLEYLRPIVYDYDMAETTFDTEGKLETVDGVTTAAQLLQTVSASDGYAGQITADTTPRGGYYPIQVNREGYGVWAYLCTYDEIVKGMEADTALSAATNTSFTAKITVTGYNSQATPVSVSSAQDLATAIADGNGQLITLTEDVTLTEAIVLDSGDRALIDLGGHTLSSNTGSVFTANPGSQLTLMNGALMGNGKTTNVIYTSGGYVSLSDMTISGAVEGVEIRDYQNDEGADSVVYITNSTITGTDDAIFIQANGTNSSRKTSVVVENSTLTGSGYAGIYCKGNAYESGTDLLVRNTTVTGYYAGIYFPQKDSTLTLENSTVTGDIGLVAKGGVININNCVLVGDDDTHQAPQENLSGWNNTGDGLYLDASYDARTTTVTITGDRTNISSTAEGSLAVRLFDPDDVTNASLSVTGGTYDSDPSAYVPTGYTVTDNGNGTYTVTKN